MSICNPDEKVFMLGNNPYLLKIGRKYWTLGGKVSVASEKNNEISFARNAFFQ